MWRAALLALALPAMAAAQGIARLEGHGGPIMDIAVSPDGGAALTASFDNSVGLWDIATGTAVWLEGHDAAVKSVIFLGDGRAASGADDFAVELWDLAAKTRIARLEGHQGQIKGLAVSPGGQWLASASWDGSIGLWDLDAGGAHVAWLTGHASNVNAVAWLDDDTLISGSGDGSIRSWDRATARQTRVMLRHGFGVTTLLMDRAAGWLAYGALDGGTRVIDLASDAVLADLTLERRPVLDLALDPEGRQLAVGDGEGHIMVVATADWDILHDFRAAARGPVWALAYTGDGRLLAGGIDDAVSIWPVGATGGGPIMGAARDFLRPAETMPNGERQFMRKCAICHSLTEDGVRRAGPTLAGIFGRRAGSYPGYPYSETVANSEIVWDAATIDALFDAGPDVYIPGTKMPMQRIADPADRADLIRYLRQHTKG